MSMWNGELEQELTSKPQHRCTVEETRSLLPRRCRMTGKCLLLMPAVKITERITGPGFPVIIKFWVSPKAYTVLILKGFRADIE